MAQIVFVLSWKHDGITAAAIHGNKSQGARTKALASFKDGGVRILVATDIAARGIDIDQLPHVVNYELPNVPEDYVHRIGRTGRAGNEGEAISLVCIDEKMLLRNIEKLIKKDIPKDPTRGFYSRSIYPRLSLYKKRTRVAAEIDRGRITDQTIATAEIVIPNHLAEEEKIALQETLLPDEIDKGKIMKKIFKLTDEKKKPERIIEAAKHEIRKYLKRERGKKLPEGADYWDFDCRFGLNNEKTESIHIAEITSALDKVHEAKWEQCYIEIIAKPAQREIKVTQDTISED